MKAISQYNRCELMDLDSQGAHHENGSQPNFLPFCHLQCPDAGVRQRKHGDVTQYIRNGKPKHQPLCRRARVAVMGVGAASEHFHKHEDETPNGDCDDEDVVEDPECITMVEDTAVEEEDAEFDAAVCEFLKHQNGFVELLKS